MSDLPLNSLISPSAGYAGDPKLLDMDIPQDEMKWVQNSGKRSTEILGFKETLAMSQPNIEPPGTFRFDGLLEGVKASPKHLTSDTQVYSQMPEIALEESDIQIYNEGDKKPATNPASGKSHLLVKKVLKPVPSHILREHTIRLTGSEQSDSADLKSHTGGNILHSEAFVQPVAKRNDLSESLESQQGHLMGGTYSQIDHPISGKQDSSKILALQPYSQMPDIGLKESDIQINNEEDKKPVTSPASGISHLLDKKVLKPVPSHILREHTIRFTGSEQSDSADLQSHSGGNILHSEALVQPVPKRNVLSESLESQPGNLTGGAYSQIDPPISDKRDSSRILALSDGYELRMHSRPGSGEITSEINHEFMVPDARHFRTHGDFQNKASAEQKGDNQHASHINFIMERFISGNETIREGQNELSSQSRKNTDNPDIPDSRNLRNRAPNRILSRLQIDLRPTNNGLTGAEHSKEPAHSIDQIVNGNTPPDRQSIITSSQVDYSETSALERLHTTPVSVPADQKLKNVQPTASRHLRSRLPMDPGMDPIGKREIPIDKKSVPLDISMSVGDGTKIPPGGIGDVRLSVSGDTERVQTMEKASPQSDRMMMVQRQADNLLPKSAAEPESMPGNKFPAQEENLKADTSWVNSQTSKDSGIPINEVVQNLNPTRDSDQMTENELVGTEPGKDESSIVDESEKYAQEIYSEMLQNQAAKSQGTRGEDTIPAQQNLPERNYFADSPAIQVPVSRNKGTSQINADPQPLISGSSTASSPKMPGFSQEKDLGTEDALSMDEPDRTANITIEMPAIEPAEISSITQISDWESPAVDPVSSQMNVESSADRVDLSGADFHQFSKESIHESGLDALSSSGDSSAAMDSLTKAEKLGESLMREIVRLRPLVDGQVQLSFDIGGESIEMHLKQDGEWIEATLQVNSDESLNLMQHINGLNDSLQKHNVRVISEIMSPEENPQNLSSRDSSPQRDSQNSFSGHQGADTNQQKLSDRQPGNSELQETNGQLNDEVVDVSLMDQLA